MNPNSYWEDRAGYLIRSVRRALGDSATSQDVLAVVEDRDHLARLAEEHERVRDDLGEGRIAATLRVAAVHLLRRGIAAETNPPGF